MKALTLSSQLDYFAENMPDSGAFAGTAGSISWKDLQAAVSNCAVQLEAFSDKRCLMFIKNNLLEELPMLISTSKVRGEFILISSYHTLERAKDLMVEFDAENVISIENNKIQILASRAPTQKPFLPEPRLGILTSGTSGAPKCARHSWDRLAKAVVINPKFQNRKWMMSYHITNFAGLQVFLQCFLNGGCFTISKTWPSSWNDDIDLIDNHKVDYLNCTATYSRKLILSMTHSSTNTVKSITLGGEVVDQALIDDLKNKFPNAKIIHIYASTEMGSRIEVKDEQAGFSLSTINNKDIRIFEGEIQLKPSERSMLSYLGKKNLAEGDAESWISTGDLVEVNEGRVYFLGRKDLMINVGGFKVNPGTVEAIIRKIQGVAEVLVTGVKSPISGNLVKATVVAADGFNVDEVRISILKECKQKLPYYSVPRLFEFTDGLALTSSSKIKRSS